jgi:ATP adenylyltransferase
MDQLWAPWRLAYISKEAPATNGNECFICKGLAENDDRRNLIVARTDVAAVVLNKYPYNNGHLLIAPRSHKGRLDELSGAETAELQELIRKMVAAIERIMRPDGFNVGLNLGKVAGAGLPGHLHWHVVPRWNGDTNFMPVVADVRVISQSLEAFYELLSNALAAT